MLSVTKINVHYLFLKIIGFNVETVEHKNVSFTSWDVGGRATIVSN